MELLNHRFGNDGVFWIRYSDMLKRYQCFDRTRLFGSEWTSTQQWTTVDVPWSTDYNSTKFEITLSESGPIVIVLSQVRRHVWSALTDAISLTIDTGAAYKGNMSSPFISVWKRMMSMSMTTLFEATETT